MRSLALALLTIYTAALLAPAIVFVNFFLQRDSIIKELCVERAKPLEQNCCKGSCHLKKELKKAGGEQDPSPNTPPRTRTVEIIALLPEPVPTTCPGCNIMDFPTGTHRQLTGYRATLDHVPWLS